jgi:N-acetylmuramate 1-kinase
MAVGGRADDEAPETVDLPHEAATIALAQWLTRFARAGDFIGLSGDLGAGKTAFARGYLRAVTGQPELEAPSPTFTLLQVYEGPDFPVVHGDFYRLRGAEELAQLGWGETIEGAVALVEWPERAADALPADRL